MTSRTSRAHRARRWLTHPSREPHRLRLALLGPLLGLAVGAAGAFAVTEVWAPRIAGAEAVNRAEVTAVGIAEGTVGPLVTADLLSADGNAYRLLDQALAPRVSTGTIASITVWDSTGRVVYALEPALVGRRRPLAAEHHRILRSGGSSARLASEAVAATTATTATTATPEEERLEHVQVAVLAGFRGADGRRYLLEAQLRSTQFRNAELHLVRQLTLVTLLVIGALFALPSSLFLARRLRRLRTERSALLAKASNASLTERRKLAQALHDDVVHELAGLGFALSATVAHPPRRIDAKTQSMLRTADGLVASSVARLREILADISPQPVEQHDLAQAVEELAEPLREDGVRICVDVPADHDLAPPIATMLFRLSRELLRNVHRHAHADHVEVNVERRADTVALRVSDDGVGFDASEPTSASAGHVGLVILADAVDEIGGSFVLTSAPGEGCRVEVTLPVGADSAQA